MFFSKRADLRSNLKHVLDKAVGQNVVTIQGTQNHSEKVIMDRTYYSELEAIKTAHEAASIESLCEKNRIKDRLIIAYRMLENSKGVSRKNLTTAGISLDLGLEHVADFSDWLKGDKIPTNKQLEDFAEQYGFSKQWILTGEGTKFVRYHDPDFKKIYDLSRKHRFSELYCLWFDTKDGMEVRMILSDGDLKCIKLDGRWQLDESNLGNGGRHSQRDLYEILYMAKHQSLTIHSSRFKDEKLFTCYWKEEYHPIAFTKKGSFSDWADQVVDYEGWPKGAIEHEEITNTHVSLKQIMEGQSYHRKLEAIKNGVIFQDSTSWW